MCFLTAPLTYPKRFHKDFAKKKKAGMLSNTKKQKKFFFKTKSKLGKKINGDFLLTQCWKRTSQKFLLFLKWRLQLCSTFVGLPMAFNDDDNHKEIKDQKCWFRKTFFARAATTNTCSYTERKVTHTFYSSFLTIIFCEYCCRFSK